jgi:hypothetical protein
MAKSTFGTLHSPSISSISSADIGTGDVAQTENMTEIESDIPQTIIRNVSSFRTLDW